MKQPEITHTTQNEFEIIHVNTGAIALSLMPGLGGKINSLRDLRTGREWLWRHPRMPYQRVPHGSSYTLNADTGGWDECFPSVMECEYPSPPWAGAAIQDHGELWSQAPTLDITEDDVSVTLHSLWQGIALPYVFERKVWLASGLSRLRFDYTVTNKGQAPLQWIWSAHPLMAIEPGMRILVPPAARFNVGGSFPRDLVTERSGLSFPMTVGDIDLTALPEPSAAVAIKLWSEPLQEGWAALSAADGEFRLRWDSALLPQVALWLNLGALAFDVGTPYYNMGLEPCIGAQDSLAEAVTRYHLFETLPPNAARSWWLEVELAAHLDNAHKFE